MARQCYDPRVPDADVCVVRPLIDRRAAETPDKIYALFADGSTWTYAQLREEVVRTAIGLQSLGDQVL